MPDAPAPQNGGAVEHLRIAIEHAQMALQAEPDDIDSQQLARVIQGLYQILASRQKESESAMGMTPAMKLLARGG